MSFVIATPDTLVAAASDLSGIGSGLGSANAAAAAQAHGPRVPQAPGHRVESLWTDEHVAVPGQQQRRRPHGPESAGEIHLLRQLKPMRHHALVRLPALPRHEIEKRPRLLLRPEEEVEELVDERIVRRQGVAR